MLDLRESTVKKTLIHSLLTLFVISNFNTISSESCVEFTTCGKCIGNNLGCVWCPDKNHTEPRCESKTILKEFPGKTWCNKVVNPSKDIKTEQPMTESVQFKPKSIKIQARPGDKLSFKITYQPAKDYPVDVYYLMDNSHTMSSHKTRLEQQAEAIYTELKRISNNVRFGVGSFVEKLALPYADPAKAVLNTFINHLPLTENIEQFITVVRNVKHTGNYDIPESALDALMQTMTCKEVNWTPGARRMIILGTDSTYHSAGEGKMVGAYRPNDMKCHLIDNTYSLDSSLLYDYPSVGQINKVASEKDIKVIFAVLKNVEKEYKALANAIQGAEHVELKNVTSNGTERGSDLVDMIKNIYLKSVREVEIDRGQVPPHIELLLDPPCNKNHKCQIGHKKSIDMNVTIHVKSCPIGDKYIETLSIGPVGLDENLKVDIEVLCQCDCEKKEKGEPNSKFCNKSGTYQCGVCKCDKNRYGKTCQCEGTSTEERDIQKCKANKKDAKVCSGRGICSCGECKNCTSGYYGNLCQYGEHDCPTHDDKVCADNGKCEFNKCKCHDGWNGTDCTCYTKEDVCIGVNDKVCSGNGICKCGECQCTKLDGKNKLYTGTFCDLCDDCVQKRCKQLEGYVECYYEKENKAECDNKFKVKSNRTIMMLNRTEIKAETWLEANWCSKVLPDQSSILFKYLDGRNSTLILIQKDKELPPVANIWVPIGSAIGAILLIGLLTVIIWKVLVDIHDAREYRKFAEESKAAGFDVKTTDNPLYQGPAHYVVNPAFNRESTHLRH